MKNNDCIFCLIANGDIPSDTVYEDEYFRAILDLSPASKGHTLLLPKYHAEDLFALPDDVAARVMPTAKKIAKAVKEAMGADGVNILQNNGEAAGQTVKHFHVHIIPRKAGDSVMEQWVPKKSDPGEQKKIAEAVAALID